MFKRPQKAQQENSYLKTIQELEIALEEKEVELQMSLIIHDFFEAHLNEIQEELFNTLIKINPDQEKYKILQLLYQQKIDELFPSLRRNLQNKELDTQEFTKRTGIQLQGNRLERLEQGMSFINYRLSSIQHFLGRLAAGERVTLQEIHAAFQKDETLAKRPTP